jgi:hypothetical protein
MDTITNATRGRRILFLLPQRRAPHLDEGLIRPTAAFRKR